MTIENILEKYDATVDIEISEMTDEQIKILIDEAHKAGLRFNRTEGRYKSCLVAIFEK